MQLLPKIGVGLAFQAPLRSTIEDPGDDFDFVEIVPDMLWTDRGPGHSPRHFDDPDGVALLDRIRRERPVVAHSIGLSIGSAHRFDVAHIEQIQRWHDRFHFPWHSDHLAYHMAEHAGVEMNVGITLPLARDRQTLELLIPRVSEVRRRIAAPFLLENNVYYFDIPDVEMDEAHFLNALCHESGCGLLLDLHNAYTNARNHGTDPWALLSAIDLALVGEIHVAGGMALDGFYLDAHSDTVPEPVWELLEWTLPRCPNIGGVVFEIFGSWVEPVGLERIRRDLRRLKCLWSRSQPGVEVSIDRAFEQASAR
jgi:uncharacterized protein (UPF0276 family)